MRWLLILAAVAATLCAQTAAPNAAGVSAGHIHFVVPDPEAMLTAFNDVLGGERVSAGPLNMVKLPNIFVIATPAGGGRGKGKAKAPAEPPAGTNGSSVHHLGFQVKSFAATRAKAEAAGVGIQELTPGRQAFLTFPDNVTVEIEENPDLATESAFHHFHMQAADGTAMRAWYVEHFGAQEGERRNLPAGLIPGGEVDFLPAGGLGRGKGKGKGKAAPVTIAGTRGRALDHIGFEVQNLQAFVDKLKADGITMDSDFRDLQQAIGLNIAFLTDPNGTYIELTEGLDSK